MKLQSKAGLLVAPVTALATGVWAEFADLNPPVLLAVAVPAMALTLISLARLTGAVRRPLTLVAWGGLIGLATFSVSEGLYLAIHYGRGGTLDFEAYESQAAMAAALFGIHAAAGTVAGLALGLAGVLVAWAGNAFRQRSRRAGTAAGEARGFS